MNRISDIFEDKSIIEVCNKIFYVNGFDDNKKKKKRVNILAMGDVGGTLALALKLTGEDIISEIGIFDLNEKVMARYESELNQILMPCDYEKFPEIKIVKKDYIFDCDVFIFCATKAVPSLEDKSVDVRMIQFENNRHLVELYGKKAVTENYQGQFFIVSDPVDPLCKVALLTGISRFKLQGFGLGVMNARAAYYSKKEIRFSEYLKEGRAYGPHGKDLVIANSIKNYDKVLSEELTKLTVEANIRTRELGFKPYIAPAVSSGALSIGENLRGNWHYSSIYFGKKNDGAFLGLKNRKTDKGIEVENLQLNEQLFEKINIAYTNLKKLV